MLVYRITLTGYASALVAPRNLWAMEFRSQKMIYSTGSVALACLENLVHRSAASIDTGNFSIATIDIPDDFVLEEVLLDDLFKASSEWELVENYYLTQKIGDDWLEGRSAAVLKVPSAIIPPESNYY